MLFLSFLWIDWHIVIYLPKVPYLLLVICPRYLRDLYGNLLIFRVISPIDSEFSFLLYKIRVSGAIIWKIFTFLLYLKKSHPSVFFSPFSVPSQNKICWWVSCHSQIGCLANPALPGRLYCSGGFHVFQHFPRHEIETSMNTDIITLIVKGLKRLCGLKGNTISDFLVASEYRKCWQLHSKLWDPWSVHPQVSFSTIYLLYYPRYSYTNTYACVA